MTSHTVHKSVSLFMENTTPTFMKTTNKTAPQGSYDRRHKGDGLTPNPKRWAMASKQDPETKSGGRPIKTLHNCPSFFEDIVVLTKHKKGGGSHSYFITILRFL